MKQVYLICNAHLDPVWQWCRDEGISAALATFYSAAELLEKYDFVFCHNESLLYAWTEKHDPALFRRIQALVAAGKWKIMAGWFLQPDCNLPSAESIIRHIQVGRTYFAEKFGVPANTAAANLDSFGHSYGLPQILAKSGYTDYVCTRPMEGYVDFPRDFVWEGVDGSRVRVLKVFSYNSEMGEALDKIKGCIAKSESDAVPVFWGIGNHGGGPSRKDLEDIADFAAAREHTVVYDLPERYFAEYVPELPVVKGGLQPCFPGCYISQIEVKQAHRALESALYLTEKVFCFAESYGISYPQEELQKIQQILLFSEFHDTLAGATVRPAQEEALRSLHAGIELARRLQTDAMLAMCLAERGEEPGTYPLFLCNPHPYPVETAIEVPLMLSVKRLEGFGRLRVFQGEKELAAQNIKEDSNIPLDWAKKVLFWAVLPPCSLERFVLREEILPERPKLVQPEKFVFTNGHRRIEFGEDGQVKSLRTGDRELIGPGGGFYPVAFEDNEDPWGMQKYQHRRLAGKSEAFLPASPAEVLALCADGRSDRAVRVIEDGPVATEVECIFVRKCSWAVLRWRIFKQTDAIDLFVELHAGEPSVLYQLLLPVRDLPEFCGQIMAGTEWFGTTGEERAIHRWSARAGSDAALAVVNDGCYAASSLGEMWELALVRTPAHTAHYLLDDRAMLPGDRFVSRIDLGEHRFSFRILAGERQEVFANVDRTAQLFNEPPLQLNWFPHGPGQEHPEDVSLSGAPEVLVLARKRRESGPGELFRLYNACGGERTAELCVRGKKLQCRFGPYELKTVIRNEDLSETEGLEI